jgi:hypothetical protein
MPEPFALTAAVEGLCDEAALRKVCTSMSIHLGDVYGRNGKNFLRSRLAGYNNSARYRPWIVLLDLDRDFTCAGEAVRSWLPTPADLMCLRIAVRELEAWLMADIESISRFLGLRREWIPQNPETLPDPKQTLISLVGRSWSRAIREDMLPRPGAGQKVGPAYTARVTEFIGNQDSGWRPEIAAERAPSLRRLIAAIEKLRDKVTTN